MSCCGNKKDIPKRSVIKQQNRFKDIMQESRCLVLHVNGNEYPYAT